MISIHQLKVTAPFRYLWLKSVTGIDLRVHCAKCLLGQYDERIGNTTVELRDMELAPAPYYYLWFREKPGAFLEVNRLGVLIIIDNAEEIRFGWQDVPPDAPPQQGLLHLPQLAVRSLACPARGRVTVT